MIEAATTRRVSVDLRETMRVYYPPPTGAKRRRARGYNARRTSRHFPDCSGRRWKHRDQRVLPPLRPRLTAGRELGGWGGAASTGELSPRCGYARHPFVPRATLCGFYSIGKGLSLRTQVYCRRSQNIRDRYRSKRRKTLCFYVIIFSYSILLFTFKSAVIPFSVLHPCLAQTVRKIRFRGKNLQLDPPPLRGKKPKDGSPDPSNHSKFASHG